MILTPKNGLWIAMLQTEAMLRNLKSKGGIMLVKECMTKKVELGTPSMSLYEAAKKMRDGDFGMLPIEDNDRLVGMITDRDIAVRCVAEGRDSKNVHVADVMTERVLYCFDDQSLEDVAKNLGVNQVRRLPVVNREKRLVGILSLCDLARAHLNPKEMENTMSCLAEEDHRNNGRFIF